MTISKFLGRDAVHFEIKEHDFGGKISYPSVKVQSVTFQ